MQRKTELVSELVQASHDGTLLGSSTDDTKLAKRVAFMLGNVGIMPFGFCVQLAVKVSSRMGQAGKLLGRA